MINDLRFKILILLFVFSFINHYSLFINHVFAAESTPSANIKEKLEELKKEIASKAAKLKEEVGRKLEDKAYAGHVKKISENSITLDNSSGVKIISLKEDTIFESKIKTRKKLSKKTIGEEDFLIALGDIDDTQVLNAKKIILQTSPKKFTKTSFWGQIAKITDKLITLKDKEGKTISATLLSETEVKEGQFVILTGIVNENKIFEAEFVYIIPMPLSSARIATDSAKPTAKKASPSPSPKN